MTDSPDASAGAAGISANDGDVETEGGAPDGVATASTGERPTAEADPELLRARLAVREEENRRLREEYARARQSQYRTTAAGLAVLGLLALVGAVIAPAERTVLVALGGVGLFGAVLTWTLTPETFVAASVGEGISAAHAADRNALRAELGLQDERVYVPAESAPAKCFVPQRSAYELPADLEELLLVPENEAARGVAFTPTGVQLYRSFRETIAGDPADEPAALATQLADAVVEEFELARSASVASDRDGDGVVVRVKRPTFGDLDATDHPIPSTIATGLAVELDRPVEARVADDGADGTVLEFRLVEQ